MSRRGRGIGEVRALGRVTLQDIARALGVSVSTVSLALRGSDRISAPVRQKVIEEAAAQGYRTDLAGALLRSSKSRIIGLLCDISQELHVEYSRDIITEAEQRGWLVMTEDTFFPAPWIFQCLLFRFLPVSLSSFHWLSVSELKILQFCLLFPMPPEFAISDS